MSKNKRIATTGTRVKKCVTVFERIVTTGRIDMLKFTLLSKKEYFFIIVPLLFNTADERKKLDIPVIRKATKGTSIIWPARKPMSKTKAINSIKEMGSMIAQNIPSTLALY